MYWAGRANLMVLYGMVLDKYKIKRATDKKYPLTPEIIQRMLNHGLEIDRDPAVCRALTMPAWVLNCLDFKLEEIVMAMMTCLKSSGVHYQCFTVKCGLLSVLGGESSSSIIGIVASLADPEALAVMETPAAMGVPAGTEEAAETDVTAGIGSIAGMGAPAAMDAQQICSKVNSFADLVIYVLKLIISQASNILQSPSYSAKGKAVATPSSPVTTPTDKELADQQAAILEVERQELLEQELKQSLDAEQVYLDSLLAQRVAKE
nr:hypothetical protein [Tanacetum cinerariifolium]